VDIYLDTNLWNELCDQAVDPEGLTKSLGSRDARLVLGTHCVYEMSKTFRAYKSRTAASRAQELFLYLKEFVESDIPCVKETMELLAAEMLALKWQVSTINPILSSDEHLKVKQEVAKLANGVFDERADAFIADRTAAAATTRRDQTQHLDRRVDTKQKLKDVRPEHLEKWLQAETMTTGAALLAEHIQGRFPEAPPREVSEWAPALLALPAYRVARGLVRADLYYNWRCAHRNSNPKDLIDDMFHVLNSTYCDVYATKEDEQSKYASFLLTSRTKVAIYDGRTKVDRWLEMLA
jgi:hypothetical protein